MNTEHTNQSRQAANAAFEQWWQRHGLEDPMDDEDRYYITASSWARRGYLAAMQAQQAEPVNQQLLALVKSFGHKTGCTKNAFGEQCTCGADEAIAAAERVTLCASCARADVNCPIYPQQTASCVEHRPSSQQQAEHVGDGESIDFPIAFLTTESGGGKYKLVLSFASPPDLHKGHDRILSAIKHCQQPAQQQAEPRCACGDSFTSDAVCANCLAAQQQAEPVARIKTVGGYPDDSRHELELLVKHGQLYDGQLLYAAQSPAQQQLVATQLVCDALVAVVSHSGDPAGTVAALAEWRKKAEAFTRNPATQQQAEPVAWMMFDRHGTRTGWTSEKEYTRHAFRSVPLYAQPPAQPVARDVLMALAKSVEYVRISGGYAVLNEAQLSQIVDAHTTQPPAVAGDVAKDAARYRLLRHGRHWSVIDGIGDELRGEALDAAIDAAAQKGGA